MIVEQTGVPCMLGFAEHAVNISALQDKTFTILDK
jgi:hypothetical protein